jgi:hypothetical protein
MPFFVLLYRHFIFASHLFAVASEILGLSIPSRENKACNFGLPTISHTSWALMKPTFDFADKF